MKNPEIGQLKVWHIPQVPMKPFEVFVDSVEKGVKVMNILADYDIFQFENKVKPDYSNAQGLMVLVNVVNGIPEWEDWYDEETGIDDPEEYLEYCKQRDQDEKDIERGF